MTIINVIIIYFFLKITKISFNCANVYVYMLLIDMIYQYKS